MENVTSTGKITWAVDAFTKDLSLHKKTVSVLKAWSKKGPLSIQPVYVLSPDQLMVPPEAFSHLEKETAAVAKERLSKLLKGTKLPGLLEPRFAISRNYSLRAAVQSLLTFAADSGAGLIIAGTQSKKGVTRFLFGSFAETLVLQSEIPILLVGPRSSTTGKLNHVLFATDLSEKSKGAIEEMIRESIERKFKVTLYNRIDYSIDTGLVSAPTMATYDLIVKQTTKARKAEMEALVKTAWGRGAKIEGIVDDKPKRVNISEAILAVAKRTKADTIALVSQTGKISTAILGSVTRQVIRSAHCPIWVVHPKTRQELQAIKQPLLRAREE